MKPHTYLMYLSVTLLKLIIKCIYQTTYLVYQTPDVAQYITEKGIAVLFAVITPNYFHFFTFTLVYNTGYGICKLSDPNLFYCNRYIGVILSVYGNLRKILSINF